MTLFSLPRLTVERQRNAGGRIADLLRAEAAAKHKRPEAITARVSEFSAAHAALAATVLAPKLSVDNAADRAIGGAYGTLTSIVQTFTDPLAPLSAGASARFDAARALLAMAFPAGIGFIRKRMETQYDAMRKVVAALRSKEAAGAVKALDFGDTVDFLEALLGPYGVAVRGPDGADVERLSDAWHASFENLALALRGSLAEGDALRDGVIDAYEKQLAAQSEAQATLRRTAKKKKKKASILVV